MPDAAPARANLPPTPVICGPTAGGKSDLAVDLALLLRDQHNLAAEIITADAFQVYQGLDIGTAKPTLAERRGVPHHLIDIIPPDSPSRFTLDDWLGRATALIADLRARNILPIVVGGTHLYVKALLEGIFEGPEPDQALRDELTHMDPALRRAELERVDPAAAQRIHPNDVRRTVRALEVYRLTGTPISEHQQQWDRGRDPSRDFLLVVLDWPIEQINRRINARVKQMIDRGLVDEIRTLLAANRLGPQAAEALGYKQLIPVIRQSLDRQQWPPPSGPVEDAVEQIKIETRRFAKNQRTWLRRLATTAGTLRLSPENHTQSGWSGLVAQRLFAQSPTSSGC